MGSVVLGKNLTDVDVDSVCLEVGFDLFWGVEIFGNVLLGEFMFKWLVTTRNHPRHPVVAFSRVSRHN